MPIILKNINLLSIPIIESYYRLQEIQAYYNSIKHINNRRDLYPIYVKSIKEFLNFNDINNYMKILDENIFNSKNKKVIIKFSDKDIKKLHPKGFALLNLKVPFNFNELKKSYKTAARKCHPDIGGSEKDMKILNEAYDLYQNFLLTSNYSETSTNESLFQFKVKNSKIFYHTLFSDLIDIYIDTWELFKAQELIQYLIKNNFFQTNLLSTNYSFMVIFLEQLSNLSKKFTSIGEYDLSKNLLEQITFYKKKYKYRGVDDSFDYVEDIAEGRKKFRIIINHLKLAENAYKINAISEKKYKELLKRFKNRQILLEQTNKILTKYLLTNTFIALPFDIKINFGFMINYIPEVWYGDNKIVYKLSVQQQYQYYYTFYIKPEVNLIKKYLFVRLCSYILSVNNYKNGNLYINDILNECVLIDKFYIKTIIADQSSKRYIESFISDIKKLQNKTKQEYDLEYDFIKKKYYEFLPMYSGYSNTEFTFNNLFEEINILEKEEVYHLIQNNFQN